MEVLFGPIHDRDFDIHNILSERVALLIQQGESLAYVKEQMGHHSIQVTVDIYGHLVPGGNKAAVDKLDDSPATIRNLYATKPELAPMAKHRK